MRSSWHGRLPVNEKKIRVHPLCSVDRETVSTLEACASRNGLRVSAVKFSWLWLRCYVVLCQKSLVGGKEFFDRSKTLRDSSRLRVFVVDWAGPLPRRREDAKTQRIAKFSVAAGPLCVHQCSSVVSARSCLLASEFWILDSPTVALLSFF